MNKKGGIKAVLVNLLLFGIFAFAIITGGIMLGDQNNAPQNIGDDNYLASYRQNLNDTLTQAHSNANSSIEAIGDSPLSAITGTVGFILDAIGGVWKTLKVVPVTIYNLTFGLLQDKIFGDSFAIIGGVISAILILIIIFAVWKWIASGQDE